MAVKQKKAEIVQNVHGMWYYLLYAGNGKPLVSSQDRPVKRKHVVLKVLENNFPDFKLINK